MQVSRFKLRPPQKNTSSLTKTTFNTIFDSLKFITASYKKIYSIFHHCLNALLNPCFYSVKKKSIFLIP